MLKRGIFISLEGIEGCGKSTQADLLAQYLSGCGYSVVLTHEPGGTPIAEKIREVLLDLNSADMTDITELLLYMASRAQHVKQLIIPAMDEAKVLICERFGDSTVAYQGYARGLDLSLIERLNEIATYGLKPDLTLLLDLDAEHGLSRTKKRGNSLDRLEKEGIEFHDKVRNGYLAIANKSSQRVKVIDASGSVDGIHRAIRKHVDQKILVWSGIECSLT